MLSLLIIENFVLIDRAEIEFNKGLGVMTGETGAGKSVIIGALNLTLGGKANKDMIRKGSKEARIQAVFDLNKEKCAFIEATYGIPFEDEKLIIQRTIKESARTSLRINGIITPLNVLKQIGVDLVDMHGQHEHQSLLNPKKHLELLDLYGGNSIQAELTNLNAVLKSIQWMDDEVSQIAKDDLEANRKLERLHFELQELEQAQLQINEDNELEQQYHTLKNIENVKQNLIAVNQLFKQDDFESFSVLKALRESVKLLGQYKDLNADLQQFSEKMDHYFYELEDLNTEIENYQETVYFDEEAFQKIEYRLDQINNLKRKYGHTIEAILSYYDEIQKEHDQLTTALEQYDKYQVKRQKKVDEYLKIANQITKLRKKAANQFEKELKSELSELNFEKAVFKVQFESKSNESLSGTGLDRVEYLISLNPGEEPKPLKKVASGGEMSRIMLAIKIIFARIDAIPLLVFDEIDSGISGRTAGIVGEKIAYISQFHQVLCISHLPQIAVMADQHYLIEKESKQKKTTSQIHLLDETERINEMSRLISGKVITEKTKEHAKEMLLLANKKKESLHKLSNRIN